MASTPYAEGASVPAEPPGGVWPGPAANSDHHHPDDRPAGLEGDSAEAGAEGAAGLGGSPHMSPVLVSVTA